MDRSSEWLALLLLLLLVHYQPVLCEGLQWSRWSWDMPHKPLVGNFRKYMNPKKMNNIRECLCPPSAECKLDYKLNEGALEFLHLRGVLKKDKIREVMEDMEPIKNDVRALGETRRYKRDDGCCCPPKTILVPAFVSNRRFDRIVSMLAKPKPSLRTKGTEAKPYNNTLQ